MREPVITGQVLGPLQLSPGPLVLAQQYEACPSTASVAASVGVQ
jgi:hypothetical protein